MIETAIVMPLFVFMVLGSFQLGLMHQARLMTKYAAYKATRAGTLHSASSSMMEAAALAALLPIVARTVSGGETFIKTTDAGGAKTAFQQFWDGSKVKNHEGTSLPVLTITICNPTSSTAETGDWDFPSGDVSNWETNDKTKLTVQVLFNYRLVIPFANMVLWRITRGEENAEMLRVTRLGAQTLPGNIKARGNVAATTKLAGAYTSAADNNIYVIPIRANWNMRMQSNFLPSKYPLPSENLCGIPFARK
jgi:hypothetical protein